MTHGEEPRLHDSLVLQVSRLADLVEKLLERLQAVETWQSNYESVKTDRAKRKAPYSNTFWRIIYGAGIAIGSYFVKFMIDHTEFRK